MITRASTALLATLMVSSSLAAENIGLPPQEGQWQLRTDLTDLTFRNESMSEEGEDFWQRTRFNVNGKAIYSISSRLSGGAYAFYSRQTGSDGQGESTGGSTSYVIKPIVRYFFTDNLGAGFSYHYFSGRNFDGDGEGFATTTSTEVLPRVMFRLPLSNELLLEAYGEYLWRSSESFDGDGETVSKDSEQGWIAGADIEYFLSRTFSANLDLRYANLNVDLENDNTDRKYSAIRADVGFSVYF